METTSEELPGPQPERVTAEPPAEEDVIVVRSGPLDDHLDNKENGKKSSVDGIDFPKSLLKRIVKEQVQKLEGSHGASPDSAQGDIQVNKEATLAFNEAAKIFIHYLTCAANDICMESKRQTLGVEDVFKALSEIDFDDLVEPLRKSLEALKRTKKKPAVKRKAIEEENGPEIVGEEISLERPHEGIL